MAHGEEYSHNASYYILLSGPELLPIIKRASVIHHSNAHKLGSSKADKVRFVKLTNCTLCTQGENLAFIEMHNFQCLCHMHALIENIEHAAQLIAISHFRICYHLLPRLTRLGRVYSIMWYTELPVAFFET